MIQLPPDTPWFVVVIFLAASTAVWLTRRYIESSLREREAKWQLDVDEQRGILEKTRKDGEERAILLQTLRDLIAQITESNRIAGDERQQARIERATYVELLDKNSKEFAEIQSNLLVLLKTARDIAKSLSTHDGNPIDVGQLDTSIKSLQADVRAMQIDMGAIKRTSQTVTVVKVEGEENK